jgi:predicted dehydrogenase
MVHKSTHHFDLVNFWLGSTPQTVFGMGDLRFYGKENAENRSGTPTFTRCSECKENKICKFAIDITKNENHVGLYKSAEHIDGYYRDQCVFGDGISIEDTMGVMVRYKNKAIMSYSLNTYLPWEGFNVVINGDKGRVELSVREKVYINGAGNSEEEGAAEYKKMTLYKMFEAPVEIEIEEGVGGHGGGDTVMLNDIFGVPVEDPYKRAASHVDGAMSILTGIAANQSFKTGLPVQIDTLVDFN